MTDETAGSGEKGRPRRIRRLVEVALLMRVQREPAHGYGLMAALRDMGLEGYPMDSSVVYRVLRRLERVGAVTSAWHIASTAGPPRRVYRITERGEGMLTTWLCDLRATAGALNALLAWYDAGEEPD